MQRPHIEEPQARRLSVSEGTATYPGGRLISGPVPATQRFEGENMSGGLQYPMQGFPYACFGYIAMFYMCPRRLQNRAFDTWYLLMSTI